MSCKLSPGQLILYKPTYPVCKKGFYAVLSAHAGKASICPLDEFNGLKRDDSGLYIAHIVSYGRRDGIEASQIHFPLEHERIPNILNK
jgi:hypothetical protein